MSKLVPGKSVALVGVVAAAALAWVGYGLIEATRYVVLYENALFFALAAFFVVVLRGRARDAALVGASLALGILIAEVLVWRFDNSTTTFREKGHWGLKGELGLSPTRPGVLHEKKVAANGQVIYDVVNTIDENLTRKVDSAKDGPTVAFFGCSFTYGAGVNDADTLPQSFADATDRKYHVVNLGVSGYGPQQMLRALETGVYDDMLTKDPKLFVILTAPWHAFRSSCKSATAWFGPSYSLENGSPAYRGSCADRRPWLARTLTSALRYTGVYEHFFGSYEQPLERADIDLYVGIIGRAAAIAREKYGVPTVVLYLPDNLSGPQYKFGGAISNDRIKDRLRAEGVDVVDAWVEPGAYPGQTLYIPGDGHPTGTLHRIWAKRIKEALDAELGHDVALHPDKALH